MFPNERLREICPMRPESHVFSRKNMNKLFLKRENWTKKWLFGNSEQLDATDKVTCRKFRQVQIEGNRNVESYFPLTTSLPV